MRPLTSPSTTRRGLLGLCVAGAAGLAGCGALGRECPAPATAGDPADWPHRYHDLGNANAAPDGPDSLSEQWTARVEASLGRPLVADGAVYAVSTTRERPFRARVHAFDFANGDRRWERDLAESHRARLAAVEDDTVYAVATPADTMDRTRLFALEADGSVAWTFDAEAITAVAAAGPVVLVSVLHGSVVALAAADGRPCAHLHPTGDPVSRWLSDVTPVGRFAFADGTAYVPTARFDTDREDEYFDDRVVALDPAGGVRWSSAVGGSSSGGASSGGSSTGGSSFVDSLAVVGDAVYVPVTHRNERAADRHSASLHVLGASTGERRWERSLDGESTSIVAADRDVVVVSSGDVYALESTSGEPQWRTDAFFGPPVLAGDRVYGRRTEGEFVDTVVAADVETGEPVAAHTFDYQLNRAPVFAGGRAVAHTLEFDDSGERIEHVADRLHVLA